MNGGRIREIWKKIMFLIVQILSLCCGNLVYASSPLHLVVVGDSIAKGMYE